VQASAALISEREKYIVAYILVTAAAGLVCGGAVCALTAAAPEPAVAGRIAALAPSIPIVLTATQAAAASTSNDRRRCRYKDIMFPQ